MVNRRMSLSFVVFVALCASNSSNVPVWLILNLVWTDFNILSFFYVKGNNKKAVTVLSVVEHIKPKFRKKKRLSDHDLPIYFVGSAVQILTQDKRYSVIYSFVTFLKSYSHKPLYLVSMFHFIPCIWWAIVISLEKFKLLRLATCRLLVHQHSISLFFFLYFMFSGWFWFKFRRLFGGELCSIG